MREAEQRRERRAGRRGRARMRRRRRPASRGAPGPEPAAATREARDPVVPWSATSTRSPTIATACGDSAGRGRHPVRRGCASAGHPAGTPRRSDSSRQHSTARRRQPPRGAASVAHPHPNRTSQVVRLSLRREDVASEAASTGLQCAMVLTVRCLQLKYRTREGLKSGALSYQLSTSNIATS